jgi:hypothetical protein
MEEELKMAREVYITEARANLRREEYWHNKSVALGFVPDPLPGAFMELPILTAAEYQPNLGGASDDESCWLYFNLVLFFFWFRFLS